MTKTERCETEETARAAITPAQSRLLEAVRSRRAVPLEEVSAMMDDVRSLVFAGLMRISARAYPWGLELELVARPPKSAEVGR